MSVGDVKAGSSSAAVPPPVPEKPLPQSTQSEDDIRQAIQISQLEEQDRAKREDEELQRALSESVTLAQDKGKGKEPPRAESTDPEELQMALAISASEAQNSQTRNQWNSSDEEDDFDEASQYREWERLQQMRLQEMHRVSMFDRHDTSSLSIITERTEQPSMLPSPEVDRSRTPMPESPNYFGLWFSPDAKGVLEERENMAILPPLSEMMADRPRKPKLPPRPLPPLPHSAPHTPACDDPFVPMIVGGSASSNYSQDSPTNSMPEDVTPFPRSTHSMDRSQVVTPMSEVPPMPSLSAPVNSFATSNDAPRRSEETARTFGYHTAPQGSPLSQDETSRTTEYQDAEEPETPGTASSEVVWPQQLRQTLPPGARRDLRSYSAYEEEDELIHPEAVRFGFLSANNEALPEDHSDEHFPDVIQLSNVPDVGSNVAEYASFGLESSTWSGMLRFLNWHGDTRIEAHPRDIASEKYGNGETELAAQFLPAPDGKSQMVRITIRLLPPNPHARRRDDLNGASSSRMMDTPKLNRKSTNVMSLPDHLVLPVHFSEVAAMLSTLRHLAFIAAATVPGQPSKKMSGHSSVNTLRSLGLRIAELSHDNTMTPEEKAQEKATYGGERVRFRDRLKATMKIGR